MNQQSPAGVSDQSALSALCETLRGTLLRPGDAAYEATRGVWNGMIDRRPSDNCQMPRRRGCDCRSELRSHEWHARSGSKWWAWRRGARGVRRRDDDRPVRHASRPS